MTTPAFEPSLRAGIDIGDLDLSHVTIRVMPKVMSRLLGPRVGAMTLGDTIFVKENRYTGVVSGEQQGLLLHELVHVAQWRREGKAGFLMRYLGDYFRNRLIGLDHEVAYRAIGFEAAAYDASVVPRREIL